jgi:uncharacterized protein (DUF2252 family)
MITRMSLDDRRAAGLAARERTPRSAHSGWEPATDRPSPVTVLEEQNAGREPDLVPVRHGRMLVSPFTFYRGAAGIMAGDLKATPRAGLDVQLCGDAHLLNFGAFGSVLDFAVSYADQNERDYAEFASAVRSGRLPVVEGV